MKFQSVFWNTK